MFTGIIESLATVKSVEKNGTNCTFWLNSPISDEFKIDQSVSHNGVCLTVDARGPGQHRVTAVAETLSKTNLGAWKPGTIINLERSMRLDGRLDGHIVQGHVDTLAICRERSEMDGSWLFQFEFPESFAPLIIEKGSICINGISLTAFNVTNASFSVAIIPYTFGHTNMQDLHPSQTVNLEFDILGKYINRMRTLEAV